METKITVLVLGVGGNVSQGILKALAQSTLPLRVVGACISPYSAGLYMTEHSYISPRADDSTFVGWLLDLCREEHVDVVVSGVEPVLSVLAEHSEEIREEAGAKCIVSATACLEIGNDKLKTCEWLRDNGFNFPRFAASDDEVAISKLIQDCGYPLIAKPRVGKGAHGIVILYSPFDCNRVPFLDGYVVQEYLGDSDSEFTVGCFCDEEGIIRGSMVMHRELKEGTTYRAILGDYPEVSQEARRIATALKPMGPCNLQFRISDGCPVCFEMNIRFSGTTPIRARFGFNEVEASLKHFVLGQALDDLPIIKEGIALRYWNEVYVDPKACSNLLQDGMLDTTKEMASCIEDLGMKV